MTGAWRLGLLLVAGVLVLIDMYLIFGYAPTERSMGIVQRLFYFHVPVILTSWLAFVLAAASSVLTFVLWLIFIGCLMVRAYAPDAERGRRWAAVTAIIGAATVPFVYMAADWWGGLHPERVTGPGAQGSLEREMLLTLLFSFVTFIVLFASLIAERYALRSDEEAVEELRLAAA